MSSIIDDIRSQFKTGSMTTRLITVNAAVFVIITILHLISRNASPLVANQLNLFVYNFFSLITTPNGLLTHPWGLITSIFSHFTFMHFAVNMLLLYSIGRLFESYLGGKKLLATYILGGIAGNLLEFICHTFGFSGGTNVIGASGAVFAVIFATAAYVPKFQVSLFGLITIELRTLAILLLVINILSIGTNNGTAYFAHIGGAIFGYLAIRNIGSSSNLITRVGNWLGNISFKRKPKSKIKIVKGDYKANAATMKDEDYNAAKKKHQERTNVILDKISKSGYESLTKEEKDFLFQQSNNA